MSWHPRSPTGAATGAASGDPVSGPEQGFTLLELTVAMGLLTIFMLFLVQILMTSTGVFRDSQDGQVLAQRGLATTRPLEAALHSMLGPTYESRTEGSDARLLVQWVPAGADPKAAAAEVQALRATTAIDPAEERQLLGRMLRRAAADSLGSLMEETDLQRAVDAMLQKRGLLGRAEMLLIPWPAGDPENAYFDLRRGYFLLDEPLPWPEAGGATLMMIREIGGDDFPGKYVPEFTDVIATGLLHLSYRLASQSTTDWRASPQHGGPEYVWDSARAGWLLDDQDPRRRFSLDRDGRSAQDATDDVFPRYLEVTVVSGMSARDLPDAHLAEAIDESSKEIRLVTADRLPTSIHDNYLKIGDEWVRFGELRGRGLRGVTRGVRGTRAHAHKRRTGVRAGRTQLLMIRLPQGRDGWNG